MFYTPTERELIKYMIDFHNEIVSYVKKNYYSDFECLLTLTKSSSYASGGMHNSLRVVECSYPLSLLRSYFKAWYYDEYKSFAENKDIGDFECFSWVIITKALVCHEIAHAIHDHELYMLGNPNNYDTKSHGKRWKAIYKQLRKHYINPFVKSCYIPPKRTEREMFKFEIMDSTDE